MENKGHQRTFHQRERMENVRLVQPCVLTKHHRLSPVRACACACACACAQSPSECADARLPTGGGVMCGRLTGPAAAEVNGEDVVDEAREVGQLAQVALQRTAGQSGLVERGHEAKHEGVQAGRPAGSITTTIKNVF